MYKKIEVEGFRGFAENQILTLAQPTENRPGSGLTIVVGANNAGKSTVIEAFRAFAVDGSPSFSQERRNSAAGDSVTFKLHRNDNVVFEIKSIEPGTSETSRTPVEKPQGLLVLPSRRVFAPYFAKSESARATYVQQIGFPALRASTIDPFAYRLFTIAKTLESKAAFNKVLAEVVTPVPVWTIDQNGSGQHFLKMTKGTASHTSEGLGEGLVSLLFIIDALYDSKPGECIIIDEPELSLHPALQRKLAKLLTKYSADRQVVIATHSPYFVDLGALQEGATVARIHVLDNKAQVSQLSVATAKSIGKLLTDANNPHVLGLNAQEAFFLDDQVILVEGQEDVIFYRYVQSNLAIELNGDFFGWGVGGADKMKLIATLLKEMGFRKVVGVLDNDKAAVQTDLAARFPNYRFFCIPAKDVRSKPLVKEKTAVTGLLDDTNKMVRLEYVDATREVFNAVNDYLGT